MIEKEKGEILKWAEKMGTEEFRIFVETLYCMEKEKRKVTLVYGNHKETGKVKEFRILYQKEFSDFDLELQLDTSVTEEGDPCCWLFSGVAQEEIKKEKEGFHIIGTQDRGEGYLISSTASSAISIMSFEEKLH